MDLAENVIAEYLSGQESMILPELAGHIVTAFGIGAKLCEQVELQVKTVPDEVEQLIAAYRQFSTMVVQAVADVTLEEVADTDADDDLDINADSEPNGNGADSEEAIDG